MDKVKWQTFADARPKPGARIVVEIVRQSVRLAANQRGVGKMVYPRGAKRGYRTPPRMEAYEHRSECRHMVYDGASWGALARWYAL